MESRLYDLLKERSTNKNTKNKIIYTAMKKMPGDYTFEDLYSAVNKYIKIFSKIDLKNKRKYVLVDNSVDSIAVFIALLKCKAIPVLVDKILLSKLDYKDSIGEEVYTAIKELDYDYIDTDISFNIVSFENQVLVVKKYLDIILNINETFEEELDDDIKFMLTTSGSATGYPKLTLIKEKDILNKDLKCFEDNYNDLYYSYISISSISGIIFNILIPLIFENHVIMDYIFNLQEVINSHINNLLLPRNILDYLKEDNIKDLDFSNIKNIYLSGESNTLDLIKQIRKKIPSLRENVFVNLYGSTETMGVISICRENYLKNIYINQLALSKGELVYTYDKINMYKIVMENDKYISKKVNVSYDYYTYFECLPVSSNSISNVIIEGNLGEIIVDGIKTGDIGTYIDNKLYVISRTSDVVNIEGTNYYLAAIEKIFSRLTGLKVAAIKIPDQNKIFIAINYSLDETSITNFKQIIPLVKKCYELCEKLSFLPLEKPMFIESNQFPKSVAMRKIRKIELLRFIDWIYDFDCKVNNYEEVFLEFVKTFFDVNTSKKAIITNDGNIFKISKKYNITFYDVVLLLRDCYITKYDEDSEYFYLTIDDCLLFNCYPKKDIYVPYGKDRLIGFIRYLKYMYKEENYIEKINYALNYKGQKIKEKRYDTLSLIGKINITKNGLLFYPYQIGSKNDIFYQSLTELPNDYKNLKIDFIDVDHSYQFYYDRYYNNRYPENFKYYTKSQLNKKTEYFKRYLDHTYFIDNYGNCYIDNVLIEEKECFIFSKMFKFKNNLSILRNEIRIFRDNLYIELKIVSKRDTIVVLNETYKEKVKWCSFDCFTDFSCIGYVDNIKEFPDYKYQLQYIINQVYLYDSIPILFVSGLRGYTIKKNIPDNLFDLVNQEKINKFLQLINLLKLEEKKYVKLNGEEIEIDFSKLKIVYMIEDGELYQSPTIEKFIELGYPKEILNNVDKIGSFLSLVEDYKNSKVKRR